MATGAYTPTQSEKRLALAFVLVAFAHLAVGILMGLFQGLQYAGINLYGLLPFARHYYQGLSIHGVFNVLIFTTFFIAGFLGLATAYGFRRPLASLSLGWATFYLMVTGVLLTDWTLFTNKASVLFTSYAPLQAHPAYYIGLALIVVGTWLLLLNVLRTYLAWRREHPGERTPLLAFGALVTLVMWGMAAISIGVLFVFIVIPWSLGWLPGSDPLVYRTLFWITGHPIVYFWLLPAYISWYFMLPKLAGGKLFSEPLARLAFLLFIPLSLPVGIHHQYLDPGLATGYKAVHAVLTFAVFVPSMITAFTVLASLETGARARGGKGRLAWVKALPWGEPAFAAQALAMVLFALGGISGLINASYTLNLVVHNTLFIPGHFHLTVGTAVTLTFMGIAYWLVPYLTGRRLWSRRLALWQAWLWFIGMSLMSRGMSWAGTLGAPRRTMLMNAPYVEPEWHMPLAILAVGGVILTLSGILFFVNLVATLWASKPEALAEQAQMPLAEVLEPEPALPAWLDRLKPWVLATVVLMLLAYGPPLVYLASTANFAVPAMRPY